jgi:hypothetical protein
MLVLPESDKTLKRPVEGVQAVMGPSTLRGKMPISGRGDIKIVLRASGIRKMLWWQTCIAFMLTQEGLSPPQAALF